MDDQTLPDQAIVVDAAINQVVVHLGESVPLGFFVTNQTSQDDYFDILVQGIPRSWLILDLPVIHLSPGERREVSLTIQAPANSPVSIGQYPLTIQVVSQSRAVLRGETVIQLLVNDYQATIQAATAASPTARDREQQVGLILHTTQFSCAPGETLSIPVVLVNRGAMEDTLSFGVSGLPHDWVTVADPVIRLASGSHRDVLIYIHPPFSPSSRAGRHPFSIYVNSQMDRNQGSSVDAQLTVTAFGQFSIEITPSRINAGETARLLIRNLGNYQDTYTVNFPGAETALDFVPAAVEPVLLMPGEVGAVEFAVSPKSVNWFGSPSVSQYSVMVQPASGDAQRSSAEVVSRSLIPVWVIPALTVMCLALLCGLGFLWNWNQNRLSSAEETREAEILFVNAQTATAQSAATTISNSLTATTAAILLLPTATGEVTPSPAPSETPAPTLTNTPVIPTETLAPTATLTATIAATIPPLPTNTNTAPPPEPTNTIQPTATVIPLPVTGEQTFVFASNRGGTPQMFLLSTNQTVPARLTGNPGMETQPVWSPDGSRIAYTSDQDGNNEIYLINADGSNAVNITQNSASDSFPAWSPDGSQVAFVSDRDGNNEIYVVSVEGGDPANVSNHPANDYKPAWYSQTVLLTTTSRILFTSDRDGNNEIFVMNTDGAEVENLTNNPADDTLPAVPYNGGRIAFVTDRDGNPEIYAMDMDGANPVNVTRSPARDTKPVWSRDGEWIAFTTDRDGNREIYIVRADGETPTNVSRSPDDDFDPTWR